MSQPREKSRDGRGAVGGIGRGPERGERDSHPPPPPLPPPPLSSLRPSDRGFDDGRRSRDHSTDGRTAAQGTADKKPMEQGRRSRSSVRSDALRRDGSRDRLEEGRSRRGDSRGSVSSGPPKERPNERQAGKSALGAGRDAAIRKRLRSVDRSAAAAATVPIDSPILGRRGGARSRSSEKPYPGGKEPDPRAPRAAAALAEPKIPEGLPRGAPRRDSEGSGPRKDPSPVRPAAEVFSDWSEGGSDDLLNQGSPADRPQKSLGSAAAAAAAACASSDPTRQESLSEPPKREKPRSERRGEDKAEGEGRSLRSQSYGSSSSRYSSISSDHPTHQATAAAAAGGQEHQHLGAASQAKGPLDPEDPHSASPVELRSALLDDGNLRDDHSNKATGGASSRDASIKREKQTSDMYEVISDDELDDIMEEGAKDDGKGDEEAKGEEGTQADLTAVDWSSLMSQTPASLQTPAGQESRSVLDKFRPGQVLARLGVSRVLAGPQLMEEVERVCLKAAEEEGSGIQTPVFESQLGAFNATAQRKIHQRRHLLANIGPCRQALCARRDVLIRKQLGKVDKTEPDQVFSGSLLDTELFKFNVQLFRAAKKGPGPDHPASVGLGADPAGRASPIAVCM